MSYARFGCEGSQVYVYECVSSENRPITLACHWCSFTAPETMPGHGEEAQHFTTYDAMFEHLRKHREAGHVVPDSCFEQLEWDRVNDPTPELLGGER